MRFRLLSVYLFFLLSLLSCDFEKFIGAETEVDVLVNDTSISGQITNVFTNAIIFKARIHIGNQSSLTDQNGNYQINYLLSEDDNRNKPVNFQISAPKYFTYSDSLVLIPDQHRQDFKLTYAAPIIEQSSRFIDPREPEELIIYQAILKDYQGNENVSELRIVQPYVNDSGTRGELIYRLNRVENVNAIKAYYQLRTVRPPNVTEFLMRNQYFWIYVFDYDGFSDSLFHDINQRTPDKPLFDPNKY